MSDYKNILNILLNNKELTNRERSLIIIFVSSRTAKQEEKIVVMEQIMDVYPDLFVHLIKPVLPFLFHHLFLYSHKELKKRVLEADKLKKIFFEERNKKT